MMLTQGYRNQFIRKSNRSVGTAPGSNLNSSFCVNLLRVTAGDPCRANQSNPIAQEKASTMNDATAAILFHETCSPSEARRILRSGRNSTYNAIERGEIPSFRIGGKIKIPTSWLRKQLGLAETS